jgi:hypothetical protein
MLKISDLERAPRAVGPDAEIAGQRKLRAVAGQVDGDVTGYLTDIAILSIKDSNP